MCSALGQSGRSGENFRVGVSGIRIGSVIELLVVAKRDLDIASIRRGHLGGFGEIIFGVGVGLLLSEDFEVGSGRFRCRRVALSRICFAGMGWGVIIDDEWCDFSREFNGRE
jgi:hypothetical protein